jgi:hypothetical protein
MPSEHMFAVVDCEKDVDADRVLMLVGTQGEAEDIARELRSHGRRIDVRPVTDRRGQTRPTPPPPK